MYLFPCCIGKRKSDNDAHNLKLSKISKREAEGNNNKDNNNNNNYINIDNNNSKVDEASTDRNNNNSSNEVGSINNNINGSDDQPEPEEEVADEDDQLEGDGDNDDDHDEVYNASESSEDSDESDSDEDLTESKERVNALSDELQNLSLSSIDSLTLRNRKQTADVPFTKIKENVTAPTVEMLGNNLSVYFAALHLEVEQRPVCSVVQLERNGKKELMLSSMTLSDLAQVYHGSSIENVVKPKHILCIIGLWKVYIELFSAIRCGGYYDEVRTISLLCPENEEKGKNIFVKSVVSYLNTQVRLKEYIWTWASIIQVNYPGEDGQDVTDNRQVSFLTI